MKIRGERTEGKWEMIVGGQPAAIMRKRQNHQGIIRTKKKQKLLFRSHLRNVPSEWASIRLLSHAAAVLTIPCNRPLINQIEY